MGKTLILIAEKRYFWLYAENTENYDIEVAYKLDIWFPISLRRKFPKLGYRRFVWLGDWSKKIEEYDKVIVFDSSYSVHLGNVLKRHHFSGGLHFVYWNKVHPNNQIAQKQMSLITKEFKIYSSNYSDCEEKGFTFSPLLYIPADLESISKNKPEIKKYDIMFSGLDKRERVEEIDRICDVFNELKLDYFIDIYGSHTRKQKKNFATHTEKTSYEKYLSMIYDCNAMLDFDVYLSKSYSLRVYEAIFYQKKYITNNTYIREEKFYTPENIFVIGVDSYENLQEFLKTPYVPLRKEILDYYSIENWIGRFA